MIEERSLVLEQPIMTSVERVDVGRRVIDTEQIGQRAVVEPVPVQTPFAARREQPIHHQHREHLIETRALARGQQARAPEAIELKLLPQPQRQPARAPLPRALQPPLCQPEPHHRVVTDERLTPILRKQRHLYAVRA